MINAKQRYLILEKQNESYLTFYAQADSTFVPTLPIFLFGAQEQTFAAHKSPNILPFWLFFSNASQTTIASNFSALRLRPLINVFFIVHSFSAACTAFLD